MFAGFGGQVFPAEWAIECSARIGEITVSGGNSRNAGNTFLVLVAKGAWFSGISCLEYAYAYSTEVGH